MYGGGGVDKERSTMAGVKLKGVGFGWGICWAGVGLVRVFANFGRAFRVNPSSWEFCSSN